MDGNHSGVASLQKLDAHPIGNTFEWTGNTSTMVKYYYAGGQRVAMRKGSSTVYYLLGDHLGSTAITADRQRCSRPRQWELRLNPTSSQVDEAHGGR